MRPPGPAPTMAIRGVGFVVVVVVAAMAWGGGFSNEAGPIGGYICRLFGVESTDSEIDGGMKQVILDNGRYITYLSSTPSAFRSLCGLCQRSANESAG